MSEGMSERVRKVEECDNGLEKECLKEFQRQTVRNYMGRRWKKKKERNRKRKKNKLTGKNS